MYLYEKIKLEWEKEFSSKMKPNMVFEENFMFFFRQEIPMLKEVAAELNTDDSQTEIS